MKKVCLGLAAGLIIGCLASSNEEVKRLIEKGKQKVKSLKK